MAASKELLPRKLDTFPMWEIIFTGGGVPPKELSGYYTSEGLAMLAIKNFQEKLRAKVRGNTARAKRQTSSA